MWGSARSFGAGHHGIHVMRREVMAGASSTCERTKNSGAEPAVRPFPNLLYYPTYGVELEIPSVPLYSHLRVLPGDGYGPLLPVVLAENPRALGSRQGLLSEGG